MMMARRRASILLTVCLILVFSMGLYCKAWATGDSLMGGQSSQLDSQGGNDANLVVNASNVVDPSCAVLARNGEVRKCTSEGDPMSGTWSYSELDEVTKLFIAADVDEVPQEAAFAFQSSRNSWGLFVSLDNVKTVEFLCDAQGASGVASLANSAFTAYSNGTLREIVNFDKTQVTSIGDGAFRDQKNLRSINLPSTLSTIGDYAFMGCAGLGSVSLPPSLLTLGSSAFAGCANLASVEGFKDTRVVAIDSDTFNGCRSLGRIELPKALTVIESSAFESCDSLAEVTVWSPYCTDVWSGAFKGTPLAYGASGSRIRVHRGSYPAFCEAGASEGWGNSIVIIEGTKGSLANAAVTRPEMKMYTGKPVTQSLKITYGDLALAEARDYDISYKDNVKAGEATIVITGKGDYVGSLSGKFTIRNAWLTDAVMSSLKSYTYTGAPIAPRPVVKLGGVTLKEGVDYQLEYSGNVNAGIARVYARGIGSCSGYVSAAYEIKRASQAISASNVSKTYGNAAFALGARLTRGDGWLSYRSSNPGVAAFDANGNVIVRGAGTATITVRAATTRNYNAASKVVTVKVAKAANPLKLAKATRSVKAKDVKKKNKAVAGAKVSRKGQGAMAYSFKSVVKKYKKYVKINKRTGKITVKKGCPKGTFKVTVKATAAGNANYSKSAAKTAVVTIKVK